MVDCVRWEKPIFCDIVARIYELTEDILEKVIVENIWQSDG